MNDELTPEQKFAAEDPGTMVPRALRQGHSPEKIVADLVRLDWTPAAAQAFVARVANDLRRMQESPESRQQLFAEARRQCVAGIVLVLLAVLVSAFTLLAALGGALPFFVLALGLFFGGFVMASRGWTRLRLYEGNSLPTGPVDQGKNRP
jgi:hypothetical protein